MYKILQNILDYLLQEKSLKVPQKFFLVFICIVLSKTTAIYVPFLYGKIIDKFIESSSDLYPIPIFLLLGYGGMRFLSTAFSHLQEVVFIKASERATLKIGLDVFNHLHSLPHEFYLKNSSGGLAHSIKMGTRAVNIILYSSLFSFIPILIELILALGVLFFLFDLFFLSLVFIIISLYFIISFYFTTLRLRTTHNMNAADKHIYSYIIDSLINFEAVKLFNRRKYETELLDKALEKQEHLAVKSTQQLSILNLVQDALVCISYILFLWVCLYRVSKGDMTIGQLVMVMTYLAQLFGPLGQLAYEYDQYNMLL